MEGNKNICHDSRLSGRDSNPNFPSEMQDF
jgi:hypothetical protein